MELDNVRSLKMCGVIVILHVIPELARSDRRQIRSITLRDACAVVRQILLRTIKTLG